MFDSNKKLKWKETKKFDSKISETKKNLDFETKILLAKQNEKVRLSFTGKTFPIFKNERGRKKGSDTISLKVWHYYSEYVI